MRKVLALVLLGGLACAAGPRTPADKPPAEAKEPRAPEVKQVEVSSFREAWKAVTASPAFSERARAALLSTGDRLAKQAETEFLEIAGEAFSAESVGIKGPGPDEVLAQLDQRSAGSLVSISSPSEKKLAVTVYSLEGRGKSELLLDCGGLSEEKAKALFLMPVETLPSAAVAAGQGELIVSDGKKAASIVVEAKSERTVATATCPGQRLFNFGEGARSYCPGLGTGGSFVRGEKGFELKETPGFPLPEKAARFIRAGTSENGEMALMDKIDNVLGEFRELSRTMAGGTTVFLGLSPAGRLWGLRGDLIAPLGNVLDGPYAALAATEKMAFVLGADGRVYRVAVSPDFMMEASEISTGISGKAVNIAAWGGTLYVFVSNDKGVSLHSIETPEQGR